MNNELPKLYIHLGTAWEAKPGFIHLLASPQDYEKMQIFFSKHFDTLSYIHDEIGFPGLLYEVKKGSMFLRDENGELIQDKLDRASDEVKK